MNLTEFQHRLSNHYSRLRDTRASENYPVYAIEHGLTPEECSTALSLLNQSFHTYTRADGAYWLVWIAAAAEIGYRYDGTEYWDLFCEALPAWLDRNRDRDKIREFYQKFAETYRGLTPSGLWAKQFPIIAWPITQAVLPRYLQRHFASHLFDLRHLFSKGGELTLDDIGELLSNHYAGRSSLFEGFLQQKALTSAIVMALGMEERSDAVAPIEKALLDRIVSDVDELGSVGRRLREARRVLRDARFINSYRPGFVPPSKASSQVKEISDRADRPRLVARPIGAGQWLLSLSMPDLASPLKLAGLTKRDVEEGRMRYRFRWRSSGWNPARALFAYTGDAEELLDSYPVETVSVFDFDRPIAAAQGALQDRLTFPTQEIRLLKIRAEGSASEVTGRYVRANHSYIIVATATLPEIFVEALGLSTLEVNAPPAHLWRLDVPSVLTAAKIAALASLGLGYRLGIRLEAVGLSPRWHAANESMTFLDTECPIVCVSSEISVREYLIQLDDKTPLRITPSTSGKTLLSLGELPTGEHTLSVSAIGAPSGSDVASEVIAFNVRSPLPWQLSMAGKTGVALKIEPREAPLAQFIEGRAFLHAIAPPRRSLKLNARFYDLKGELFSDAPCGRLVTPVDERKLSAIVVQKLTSDAQIVNVERAARIELAIALDEYGCGTVDFEKSVDPIRWIRIDNLKIRLSDDTGDDTPLTVERFDLDAVNVATEVNYDLAIEGFELRGKGSLLVATHKGRPYEAIATTTQRNLAALSDLGMPAKISGAALEPPQLIRAVKRWNGALRLMGPMAFLRPKQRNQSSRACAMRLLMRQRLGCVDRWCCFRREPVRRTLLAHLAFARLRKWVSKV